MMEVILYFAIGLGLIGIPSFVFYRLGIDIGVTKGVRKQLIRELMHSGILEEAESMQMRRARSVTPAPDSKGNTKSNVALASFVESVFDRFYKLQLYARIHSVLIENNLYHLWRSQNRVKSCHRVQSHN